MLSTIFRTRRTLRKQTVVFRSSFTGPNWLSSCVCDLEPTGHQFKSHWGKCLQFLFSDILHTNFYLEKRAITLRKLFVLKCKIPYPDYTLLFFLKLIHDFVRCFQEKISFRWLLVSLNTKTVLRILQYFLTGYSWKLDCSARKIINTFWRFWIRRIRQKNAPTELFLFFESRKGTCGGCYLFFSSFLKNVSQNFISFIF